MALAALTLVVFGAYASYPNSFALSSKEELPRRSAVGPVEIFAKLAPSNWCTLKGSPAFNWLRNASAFALAVRSGGRRKPQVEARTPRSSELRLGESAPRQ